MPDAEREMTPGEIEFQIQALVRQLDDYAFDEQTKEMQEELFWAREDARMGPYRARVIVRLEALIPKLRK